MAIGTNEEEGNLERKCRVVSEPVPNRKCADEDVGLLRGVDCDDLSGRVQEAPAATWCPVPHRLGACSSGSNPRMGDLLGSLTKPQTVGHAVAKLGTISVGKGPEEPSGGR
ncbi:hypothetical protein FNV43_RR27245 [Rhamnella rubrinervis]|uniref:Uncharacterized protein n=1 Tax=Rhamnella rubrinervis TaxID=2594499 RepID=A0A8K0GSC7_9ROSA|nr:hypothetical protein FNV43_RR27245 [Rhamnella rubrinervis]